MQGAIRNIDSLEKWFKTVNSPFFTLTYAGQNSQVILRNVTVPDVNEAWDMLKQQVLNQAEYGRATLHVITYKKEGQANNPDARTNIDILPVQPPNGQMAGIGALPGMYGTTDIEKIIAQHREKWELEKRLDDLEQQLKNPDDWTEKVISGIERISGTPFGQAMISRMLGGSVLPMGGPAPINGTPQTANEGADNPADTFDDDLEATCEILNVDDTTLLRKLRALVENNPETAKAFLQ